MSEEKGPTRPRQVTTAVVIAVIGCLVLVISLFDTLGRLRTPAMRDAVGDFLAEAPGNTLGLDTPQVIDLMRGLAFVSGALAAMGLVFAVFAMQRHRGARIGYTVVTALLVLTIPVAGLMPFFLAAAAFLLWSGPARDWFLGRMPAPVAATPAAAGAAWSYSESTPPTPRPADDRSQPPAHPSPYGQAPEQSAPQQPYAPPSYPAQPSYPQQGYPPQGYPQQQYAQQPYSYPPAAGRDHDKRPLTVTLAAVLTWIGAGATTLLMLGFIAILAAGGDAFVEEFDRAARESEVTLDTDEILAVGWGIAITFLIWSLIAIVLAILAFRRSNGARWTLVVSAVMSALFSLVAIMSILSIVTLLLSVAVVVMLFAGGANQWYADRRDAGGPSSYPPSYQQGYPQTYPPYQPEQPQAGPPTGPPAGGRQQPW